MFVSMPYSRVGLCFTVIFDMICWPQFVVVLRSKTELWSCSGCISLVLWLSVCAPWFGGWVCVLDHVMCLVIIRRIPEYVATS